MGSSNLGPWQEMSPSQPTELNPEREREEKPKIHGHGYGYDTMTQAIFGKL